MLSSSFDDLHLSQYCHFGWGENRFGVPNYYETCAKFAIKYMEDRPKSRAFDVGCAIGRSSFELARVFDEVIGVDPSARCVLEAQRFKESGILHYTVPIEGVLREPYEARLNKFGLEHASKKVNFWQADPCDLKPMFSNFNLVLACSILERIDDPRKFLEEIGSRLCSRGLLVLVSSYDWSEEITPKEKWIGGYERNGEDVMSLQGLEEILAGNFKLLDTKDVSFVFQETARTHQYTVAQMSVWEHRQTM